MSGIAVVGRSVPARVGDAWHCLDPQVAIVARVVVRCRPTEVELEITDNGQGTGDGHADGQGDGHGPVGMRERAALVSGNVQAGTNGGRWRGYTVRARPPE